jgi:hypothetical protein
VRDINVVDGGLSLSGYNFMSGDWLANIRISHIAKRVDVGFEDYLDLACLEQIEWSGENISRKHRRVIVK